MLCPFSLNAQQNKIDSLHILMSMESDPLKQIDMMNKLASYFHRLSADSSLFYATGALELSEDKNYSTGTMDALLELAIANSNIGNFDKAKSLGKQGLSLALEREDNKRALSLSSNIGRAYARQGSFHGALFYFRQALDMSDSSTNSNSIANIYNSLGTVYILLKEYELASDHYEKALGSYGEEPDQRSLSMLYNNMGGSYAYQKSWEKALEYYSRALKINEQLAYPCLEISQVYNIGEIYLELGDLDQAAVYLKRSKKLADGCENKAANGYILYNLGKLEAALGNDRQAIYYFDKAMNWINDQNSFSDIDQVTKEIYQFYRDRGMLEKALEYLEIHTNAKDSVHALADIQKIAALTSEHEFEKERDILRADQAKAELSLQNDLTRERFYKNTLIIATTFFVFLAVIYYLSARHRRTSNRILEEQNQLVNEQKQILIEKTDELTRTNQMINKLHEFKEDLTHMIAHDLKNGLNSILALSNKPKDREMEIIHQNGGQALGLITNMLDVYKFEDAAMNLKIEDSSFNQLLKCAETEVFILLEFNRVRLVTDLDYDIMIPVDQGIVSRVLVNLLTNAIKYSAPGKEIHIRATFLENENGEGRIQVELEDQGEGIAENDLPYVFDKYWQSKARNIKKDISTGLGLTFCKMAVEAHQGSIEVKSDLHQGTTFFITLPALKKASLTESINPESKVAEGESIRTDCDFKACALKFRGVKVHEVSRIRALLKEMKGLDMEAKWIRELEMAMYRGSQDLFDELTESLLT
ncbi:MAG: tetratricopeptide repeat protein [Roseivirga sp.]|nr:tetratricopeptide repeat protein [Roseivirga sp.]